jgi:hypothetical protein
MQVRQMAKMQREKRVMTKAGWRGMKASMFFCSDSDDETRFSDEGEEGRVVGVGCDPRRKVGSGLGERDGGKEGGVVAGWRLGLKEGRAVGKETGEIVGKMGGIVGELEGV